MVQVDGIAWEWAIARYTGEKAKYVKSLADMGIGYYIRSETGKGLNYGIEVGFRRPLDSPRPEGVSFATETSAQKLDKLFDQRNPKHGSNKSDTPSTPGTIRLQDLDAFKRYRKNNGSQQPQDPFN